MADSDPIPDADFSATTGNHGQWPKMVAAICVVTIFFSFITFVRESREAARRSNCKGQIKQIGLALLNYRETHGRFPPPYFADENGRPIHSWRVLILPYLDRQGLYNEYRFDEPWDGPHNRQLANRLVHNNYSIWHCPSDEPATGQLDAAMTSFVAVLGPETFWDDESGTADFSDPAEQTLMVVEVANSGIHWMEPRDLHVSQMASTINPSIGYGISSRHQKGVNVTMADDSVRFLSNDISENTLRALLTRDGHEEISQEEMYPPAKRQ